MKGEKKRSAAQTRDALLLSCQVDSTVLVVDSRRKLSIFSSSLLFYPTTLHRALQVVVFKTNLVFFLFYSFYFLFRSTTSFRISGIRRKPQTLPVHSSVVLLLFSFNLLLFLFFWGFSCCCLCLWGCVCLCFDFQPRCTTHDTPRTTWTIVANDLEHGKYF